MLLFKVVAIATLLTLAGPIAVGATVLCFGADGHSRAEPEIADHHSLNGASLQHGNNDPRVMDSGVPDHPPCMDVALSFATKSKVVDEAVPSHAVLSTPVMPPAQALLLLSPMLFESTPGTAADVDTLFAALRSPVLRI